MYTLFAIAGINVVLISSFPKHEDCRSWLNANRQTLTSILGTLPVQVYDNKPALFFCSQKPPAAGTTTE